MGTGKRGLGGQPKSNSVDNACYFHAENTKGSPDLVTVAGSRRILSKITWKLKPKGRGCGYGGWVEVVGVAVDGWMAETWLLGDSIYGEMGTNISSHQIGN